MSNSYATILLALLQLALFSVAKSFRRSHSLIGKSNHE